MLTFSSLVTPPYFGNLAQVLCSCQKHKAVTVFGIRTHVISRGGCASGPLYCIQALPNSNIILILYLYYLLHPFCL
jgi:hypothetical protein